MAYTCATPAYSEDKDPGLSMELRCHIPGSHQTGRGRDARSLVAALAICLGAGFGAAIAQELPRLPPPIGVWSKPVFGSTPDLAKPAQPNDLFGNDQDTVAGVHMSITGKPCVTVAAEAMPDQANPKNFFHMALAANACSQRILIEVCYYQTLTCSQLQLPPYGRKETMLGIMPAMKGFRYEYREQVEHLQPLVGDTVIR